MQVNMTDLSKIVQTNNKTLSVMSFWVKQSSTKRDKKSMTQSGSPIAKLLIEMLRRP